MATFEANSRVPTRPLSYANKHMASKKELMVDYDTGLIYIVDTNGNVFDVSVQIYDKIIASGDVSTPDSDIAITDPSDPSKTIEITIREGLYQSLSEIESIKTNISTIKTNLEKSIDAVDKKVDNTNSTITTIQTTIESIQQSVAQVNTRVDDSNKKISSNETAIGNINQNITDINGDISSIKTDIEDIHQDITDLDTKTNALPAANITTDSTHQFVTSTQKTNLEKKVTVTEKIVDISVAGITGTEAPYTCEISVPGLNPDYPSPIVDIAYTDSFSDNESFEDSFYLMYRCSITEVGKATLYFKEIPPNDFRLKFQIYTPGI